MAAKKARKVKVSTTPLLREGEYTVEKVNEMNSFDLTGERNKTKGTSNKFYHAELHFEKNGSRAQIYTIYGPTGRAQKKEYRHFDADDGQDWATNEYEKLLKSKRRKGYHDIDVAQRSLGTTDAQQITKPVKLNNDQHLQTTAPKSRLNEGQRRITEIFFGSQQQFVAQTLKCPLGQLTNDQIDKGRDCLDQAKVIVNKKRRTKADTQQIADLTNTFYATIPHNLGSGARGQMTHLLLDDIGKVVAKEQDLDTLLDAKQVNAVLKKSSTLDDKYDSLNCDFEEVQQGTDLWKFLASYFMDSKVSGHRYNSAYVSAIWAMTRKDAKEAAFIANAERIAKKCGSHTFARSTSKSSRGKAKLWTPDKRPDLDKDAIDLYRRANVWLCWHGTRSANLVGITRRGLLVRPSGAVHTGSMYGDGKYFAWQSTKSLNYTDGGFWTGGRHSVSARFMFLMDVSLGKQHIAEHSKFYRGAPSGCHSVYAPGGSAVWNDEMITYDFDDKDNQSKISYLFEIKER